MTAASRVLDGGWASGSQPLNTDGGGEMGGCQCGGETFRVMQGGREREGKESGGVAEQFPAV